MGFSPKTTATATKRATATEGGPTSTTTEERGSEIRLERGKKKNGLGVRAGGDAQGRKCRQRRQGASCRRR